LQSKPSDSEVNCHVRRQLGELVAASIFAFSRFLAPKGGYEQRLHEFEASTSLGNYLVAQDTHCFPHELIVHVYVDALRLLGESVGQHGEQQDRGR
jgi:hypothetical protein